MSQFIDLSVVVNENTPAYPGDPHVSVETLAEYKKEGYNDHKVSFGIHSSGTHIDAPWHMLDAGRPLDKIPLEDFIGPGKLVTLKSKKFDLESVKQAGIEAGGIVLFNTGMGKLYHDPAYFDKSRPAMGEDVANYLVEKKVKMIGLDVCSPDKEPFPIHRILLGAGILIIENLTNLEVLSGKEFVVYALPLKLQLDGAPARVIAKTG